MILLAAAILVCLSVLISILIRKNPTPPTPPPDTSSEAAPLRLFSGSAADTPENLTAYDVICLFDCPAPETYCPKGYSLLSDKNSNTAIFYRERFTPRYARTLSLSEDGSRGGIYTLLRDEKNEFAVFSMNLRQSNAQEVEMLGHRLLCYKDYFPTFLGGELSAPAAPSILEACGLSPNSSGYSAHFSSSAGKTDAAGSIGLYPQTTPKSLDFDKKRIALTYDDGPSKTYTLAVLDALEKHNAKATFYVMGSHVAGNEALLKRAFSLGSEIGNHSNLHEIFSQNPPSIIKQTIETTNEAVRRVLKLGTATVRPPAGECTDKNGQPITPGYPIILWSIDTLDYKSEKTGTDVTASVLQKIHDGAIVLMHDIHAPAADAADSLIAALLEADYQLVTVSELLEFSEDGPENNRIYTKIDPSHFSVDNR